MTAAGAAFAEDAVRPNDFPTSARVDYVLGCMASNGDDRLVMEKCACSIDQIAGRIPYKDYEKIETIMRMRQAQGERAAVFREVPWIKDAVDRFRQLQVEADLVCFK
ncbi:MAG: hypothetical protein GC191_19340 [Azospirillum sp.]|nr:hypothetical protein [Azospirillum sp.]